MIKAAHPIRRAYIYCTVLLSCMRAGISTFFTPHHPDCVKPLLLCAVDIAPLLLLSVRPFISRLWWWLLMIATRCYVRTRCPSLSSSLPLDVSCGVLSPVHHLAFIFHKLCLKRWPLIFLLVLIQKLQSRCCPRDNSIPNATPWEQFENFFKNKFRTLVKFSVFLRDTM